MMERPYGKWQRLYVDGRVELRKIEIAAGGFCSWHYHDTKHNWLFVADGVLLVHTERSDKWDAQTQKISSGQPGAWLPDGVRHQFEAETDVVAYEFSMSLQGMMMDPDEIHRLSEAGKHERTAD